MHHSTLLKQNERTMTNGKYAPLFQHLAALGGCRWRATFAEIESILGFSLPQSARAHRAWWENRHRNHTQARSWLAAGWQTSAVNLQAETLVFKRLNPDAAAVSYPRRRPRPPAPQAHARGTPEITFVAGGGTVMLGRAGVRAFRAHHAEAEAGRQTVRTNAARPIRRREVHAAQPSRQGPLLLVCGAWASSGTGRLRGYRRTQAGLFGNRDKLGGKVGATRLRANPAAKLLQGWPIRRLVQGEPRHLVGGAGQAGGGSVDTPNRQP